MTTGTSKNEKKLSLIELADQIEREHTQAIRALDAAHGHSPGTVKHITNLERHERHSKRFDELMVKLREYAAASKVPE